MKMIRTVALFPIVAVFFGCSSPSSHSLPPQNPQARAVRPPPLHETGAYGEASFDANQAKPLIEAMPSLKNSKKSPSPVIVTAKVLEVCPKKGCWMNVQGLKEPMRVTFKDYAFFVPVELVGREVALQGEFVVHRESVAEQKHLAEDAKKPQSEIDEITVEKQILRFVATGVKDLSVSPQNR
ncbi:MAG TPA: DUF4920 domain-containing protein [Pseudobdellovibrionaceae bacterium]|nr:DUF4920 domain-containing protein [Pseudobdellovibrionaceae bacterium]